MQRFLDDLAIDVGAHVHTRLEVTLVVAFSALGLNILLDAVNLRLVSNQALLNIVQTVVDIRLEDLVLASVVLDGVVSGLLSQLRLVLLNKVFDKMHALLLLFKLAG